MAGTVFFGNSERAVSIPAPRTGADGSYVGRSNLIQLENGGAIVEDSIGQHLEFSWEWIGDPTTHRIIREFAHGVHGPGPFWWVDPFADNLFAPNWAAPRLAKEGWKPIFDAAPTAYPATTAGPYGHPGKSATYNLPALVANLVPARRFTVLLPPGNAFWFGASGSRTGTGVVGVRGVTYAGTYSSVAGQVPLDPAGVTRFSSLGSFNANTYRAVEIFLTKTSTAASTITLASMIAKLAPIGSVPDLGATFISGEGSTGLSFAGGVRETLYTAGGPGTPRRKGFSTKLVETEAWEL